jgi:hypothetical protein
MSPRLHHGADQLRVALLKHSLPSQRWTNNAFEGLGRRAGSHFAAFLCLKQRSVTWPDELEALRTLEAHELPTKVVAILAVKVPRVSTTTLSSGWHISMWHPTVLVSHHDVGASQQRQGFLGRLLKPLCAFIADTHRTLDHAEHRRALASTLGQRPVQIIAVIPSHRDLAREAG